MYTIVLAVAIAAGYTISAQAHEHESHKYAAHVHGIAKLEVVVEGNTLSVHLETPLDGVLGFEHAPGNAKERAEVAEMRRKLADGGKLFVPTAAAQCTLKSVQVAAPMLDEKARKNANPKANISANSGHGDLDADFLFSCAQPAKLSGMEVKLFAAFPKVREVGVQVVTAKRQFAMRLNARNSRLSW